MTHEEFQKRFRYSIEKDRLGEGGFGEVFKAYDNYIDRWVAIKVSKVKPDLQEIRLRNEVEMVNKLPAHPNIARYDECYSFSSIAGEFDFGILQYYEDGNLLQLMHNQKLSSDQKHLLLRDLLDGIEFMHESGIIHRDLKPQNILIVKRGDFYVPKITDFGISKKLDYQKGSVFNNSLAGAGTLAYASPEQLGGKAIRKNTDLWSFGVIACQLLAGELPFNSGTFGNTSEAGRQEMLRQINQGLLPDSINSLDQPWQEIVKQCLETDPEFRIKSAAHCLDLLEGKDSRNAIKSFSESFGMDDGVTEIEASTIKPKKRISNRKKIVVPVILVVVILFSFIIYQITSGKLNELLPIDSDGTLVEKTDSIEYEKSMDSIRFVASSSIPATTEVILQNEEKVVEQDDMYDHQIKTHEELVATESELKFPNGDYYIGKVRNGKMHGEGKYYFAKAGLVSKNDPLERKAESGCYIIGDWYNGDLYKGKLYDKNGIFKERIILGRN